MVREFPLDEWDMDAIEAIGFRGADGEFVDVRTDPLQQAIDEGRAKPVRVQPMSLPPYDEAVRMGLLDDMPDFSEEPMTSIISNHFTTDDGKPDGGSTFGPGFAIAWQRGPLVADDVMIGECIVTSHWMEGPASHPKHNPSFDPDGAETPCRRAQNGAFVEDVIEAVIGRITHYEMDTPFGCEENRKALEHLNAALGTLRSRTQRRRTEGLEGTSTPGPGDDGSIVKTFLEGDFGPGSATLHREAMEGIQQLIGTHQCEHCGHAIAHIDDEHPEDETKWVHVRQESPLRPCIVDGRRTGTMAFPRGMQSIDR